MFYWATMRDGGKCYSSEYLIDKSPEMFPLINSCNILLEVFRASLLIQVIFTASL